MIALLGRSATQARYALIASYVLLCGFQMIIIGQAAEIQRTQGFGRVAELMPAFLQRGLGSRALLLATFKGTVAFGYFHPVVCLLIVIVAMYVATEPAHEIESGLVDIELARSVPRHRLLTRSLLLAELSIAGAVAGFWAGLIVDTANLVTLGVSSLLLTIAGYWIGRYGETTGRDRAHAPYLSVGVVTVLYAIGALIVHYMLGDPVVGRTVLLDSLPPSLLLNLLLTAPVYAVVRRLLPPVSTHERTTEVSLLG